MKFNIKMGEDFDFKVGAHNIHVRFVSPRHPSLKHKEPSRTKEEVELAILEKLLNGLDPGQKLNKLLDVKAPRDLVKDHHEEVVIGDFGCYNSEEYTIYIRHPDNFTVQLSTFFHEFIHVIEQIYTIEFDHQHLNLVAEVLTQVMIDNFAITKTPKNVRVPRNEKKK